MLKSPRMIMLRSRDAPKSLAEIIGQEQVKENLHILIYAARHRNEPMDHVSILWSPGLGKTTFAHVLPQEMGVNIKATAGPAIERPGDLAAILTNLHGGDILFIDEIHRLGKDYRRGFVSSDGRLLLGHCDWQGTISTVHPFEASTFHTYWCNYPVGFDEFPLACTFWSGVSFGLLRYPCDEDYRHTGFTGLFGIEAEKAE